MRLGATGQLLVRSGVEIGHALQAICERGEALTAEFAQGEMLFVSRLLRVDPETQALVVAWSEDKHANALLLASDAVTFSCSHDGAYHVFVATGPREFEYEGGAAIRMSFPLALYVRQRRDHPRVAVPPRVPLRCEITWGAVSFDANVVDVGVGGIGGIVYDAQIHLGPGALLERARIFCPGEAQVLAALEVRNVKALTLTDGSVANRAGCRFIGPASGIERLIRLFVTALDPAAPGG